MADAPLSTPHSVFHGPADAFLYLQKAMQLNFCEPVDYTLSWQSGQCYGALPTAYVREALAKPPALSMARANQPDTASGTSRTLLHGVAANLIDSLAVPFDSSDVMHILSQVLGAPAHLHPQDRYGATPFDYLCCGTQSPRISDPSPASPTAVGAWFQALLSAGIDVHEYIKEECRFHPTGVLIHCAQVRSGIVRRFHFKDDAVGDQVFLSVWDEFDEPVQPCVPGSWPDIDFEDMRQVVYNQEPVASWDLAIDTVLRESD
jgi:hypothetical protein